MDQNRKEYLMQASLFEALFARLAQSDFRSRFRLGPEAVSYTHLTLPTKLEV